MYNNVLDCSFKKLIWNGGKQFPVKGPILPGTFQKPVLDLPPDENITRKYPEKQHPHLTNVEWKCTQAWCW